MRRALVGVGLVVALLVLAALGVSITALQEVSAQDPGPRVVKDQLIHFVNETENGGALGHHLAALGVSNPAEGDTAEHVNLVVFFEGPGQSPAEPPHAHLMKLGKAHDADTEPPNTWHYQSECLTPNQ